jgi:hypothetical protein
MKLVSKLPWPALEGSDIVKPERCTSGSAGRCTSRSSYTPADMTGDVDDSLEPGVKEIKEVLATLRSLVARVSSPVVRACLEDAHDDILHLTEDQGRADVA